MSSVVGGRLVSLMVVVSKAGGIQLHRKLELTSLFDTPVADALFYSILVFCCGI